MAKRKPKTVQKLADEAARLLQRLRCMMEADDNGYLSCFICNKVIHWKDAQGGHFIPRGYGSLKLIIGNIREVCEECNCYKDGNIGPYRKKMIESYGEVHVRWLEDHKHDRPRWTRADLAEMVAGLKTEIRAEQNRLGGEEVK